MKHKWEKYINFVFPMLVVCSIVLSSLSLWQINNIQTAQSFLETPLQDEQSKEASTRDEMQTESDEQRQEQLQKNNKELKKRSLVTSSDKPKKAYFQRILIFDEENDVPYESTAVLVEQIGEPAETVFTGDYRLSYLEWLDDRELIVYRSCGTECMGMYIIDTETKEQEEMMWGVGYTWSPNKQYVVSYHYSRKYGITLAKRGTQYGQTVFELRREHPPLGSGLSDQTQVAWSVDSSKLAVIIRKHDEEKLELLVYDVVDKFKLIYQQNLVGTDISSLTWASLDVISWTEDGKGRTTTL